MDELEQAKWGYHGSLRDVVRVDRNLMVGPDEIDLRKDCASRQLRGEVLDVGDRSGMQLRR